MTWQPVTYDPELNLLYVTTGNPQPVIAFRNREGANLFTASIVALNPDTGKMVWYFQSSPQRHARLGRHADGGPDSTTWSMGVRASSSRRRPATALYFLLDRTNGKAIVSSDYAKTNWSKGYDAKGQPDPEPGEEAAGGRRARDAESGRRDELAATELQPARPDCSTSPRRARSASSTSTIRARTRRGGAARIAAAGRSRCCRRSTTRRARSAGRIAGTANTRSGLLTRPATCSSRAATRRSRRAERHDGRRALARASRQQRLATDPSRTNWTVASTSSSARATRCCVRDEQRKVRRWRE